MPVVINALTKFTLLVILIRFKNMLNAEYLKENPLLPAVS